MFFQELNGSGLGDALKAVDNALPSLQQNPNDSAQTLSDVALELSHNIRDEEELKTAIERIFQEVSDSYNPKGCI